MAAQTDEIKSDVEENGEEADEMVETKERAKIDEGEEEEIVVSEKKIEASSDAVKDTEKEYVEAIFDVMKDTVEFVGEEINGEAVLTKEMRDDETAKGTENLRKVVPIKRLGAEQEEEDEQDDKTLMCQDESYRPQPKPPWPTYHCPLQQRQTTNQTHFFIIPNTSAQYKPINNSNPKSNSSKPNQNPSTLPPQNLDLKTNDPTRNPNLNLTVSNSIRINPVTF